MQELITAKGKTFRILWCAVSTVDYVLRFEVVGMDFMTAISIFNDKRETSKLTKRFDETETEYIGYTKLVGIDQRLTGSVVVSLAKET